MLADAVLVLCCRGRLSVRGLSKESAKTPAAPLSPSSTDLLEPHHGHKPANIGENKNLEQLRWKHFALLVHLLGPEGSCPDWPVVLDVETWASWGPQPMSLCRDSSVYLLHHLLRASPVKRDSLLLTTIHTNWTK